MSTSTTNYNFVKPSINDPADITTANANWDKIDTELKNRKLGEIPIVTATSIDGVTYTGTVEGITTLSVGYTVIFIPDTTSTSDAVKFNLNGLGDKYLKRTISKGGGTIATGGAENWCIKGLPIFLTYNGTYWFVVNLTQPSATDLYGKVPLKNGGWFLDTGTTAADKNSARNNLILVGLTAVTKITIPNGRMRGDIDGDGYITQNDYQMIYEHVTGSNVITDETQLLCADVNHDGSINVRDYNGVNSIITGKSNVGVVGDILNNWTGEDDFHAEYQFHTDIVISGMNTSTDAIITIPREYNVENFSAECIDGKIRINAKLCPIESIPATVQFFRGNGTCTIVKEGVDAIQKSGGTLNGQLLVNSNGSVVMTSPNGTKYKLTVNDSGALSTTAL